MKMDQTSCHQENILHSLPTTYLPSCPQKLETAYQKQILRLFHKNLVIIAMMVEVETVH